MAGTIEAYRMATLLSGCEAVFGTSQAMAALTDMWEQDAFNPFAITPGYRTNAKKIKGARGMTARQRETAEGAGSINDDASVELITWMLALGMGNDTPTGGGDPYTHTIKHPSLCSSAPKSTDFLQAIVCSGLTAGYKSFKGCALDKFSISGDTQGFLKLASSWKTDGSEVTQAGATPTSTFLSLSYLLNSMVSLKLYPNGGSVLDVSGGGSNQLMSWKAEWDFGLTRLKRASNSIYVPGWRFGEGKPTLKISFVLAADKSDAVYGYFSNDTLLTLQLGLTFSASRLVTTDMSNCYIVVKEGSDGNEPTLECTVDEMDVIANQGPAIYTCKTAVPAYLQGT